MHDYTKRAISVLLAVAIFISLIVVTPMGALAEEPDDGDPAGIFGQDAEQPE